MPRRAGATARDDTAGLGTEIAKAEEEQPFGSYVKALRRGRKWTLELLGSKTGLSISALSKIENGQVSASFDTRVKIAHAFDQSFGQLLRPAQEQQRPMGRRTYTRAGEGLKFHTAAYDYDVHSTDLMVKGMIPLIMRIKARELVPLAEWSSHDGEEFIYVTAGAVELHTELYSPLHLAVGDSAYIDSTMRHAFVSVGDGDAAILSICMTEQLQFQEGKVGRSRL